VNTTAGPEHNPDSANPGWPLRGKISLGILLALLAFLLFTAVSTVRLLTSGVPAAYHKEWTFNFIREYQKKTGTWPRSWDEIEKTLDTSSPFAFTDIKRSVVVKWENLGVIITDPNDCYFRTDPDVKWQGDDWNRDMIRLIKDTQVPKP
jgi:hypothetical protein